MKLYGIYDKSTNALFNDWVRTAKDVRELYTLFKQLVNDPDKGGILYEYTEDFQLIELGEVMKDYIALPIDETGKITKFKVIKELREFKTSVE